MPTQFRQGDVLVEKTDSVPSDAVEVPREDGKVVLAHGEATGHCHAISSPAARLLSVSSRRFLRVEAEVDLEHQEHDTVKIPQGDYQVVRQREYVQQATRNVAD